MIDEARNMLLLLFCPVREFPDLQQPFGASLHLPAAVPLNPLLVLSVIGAQGLHIAAMHLPGLSETLRVAPVTLVEWGVLFLIASALPATMEFDKWRDQRRSNARAIRATS